VLERKIFLRQFSVWTSAGSSPLMPKAISNVFNLILQHAQQRSLQSSNITMALARLPNEVIEQIITHVIPEGFESVALTYRKLYTLCISFIKRYNTLRSQFQHFTYYPKISDPSFTIRSSFDLIARIAVEPVVARYIVDADFKIDSFFKRGRPENSTQMSKMNAAMRYATYLPIRPTLRR